MTAMKKINKKNSILKNQLWHVWKCYDIGDEGIIHPVR
jgi:hypothetical protein